MCASVSDFVRSTGTSPNKKYLSKSPALPKYAAAERPITSLQTVCAQPKGRGAKNAKAQVKQLNETATAVQKKLKS